MIEDTFWQSTPDPPPGLAAGNWHDGLMASADPIRVAVVGPTGYAGYHLVDLLLRHPRVELTALAARRDPPVDLRDEFPKLTGRLPAGVATTVPIHADTLADRADVAFLALPHKASMAQVPGLLEAGMRVIDCSADYRLRTPELYEQTYGLPHTDPEHLAEAVYGLPELFRNDLPDARLVAMPGCYPTAAALAVAPLLSRSLVEPTRIVINASCGVTGAGRTPAPALHFPTANEAYGAYGTIGGHRHQPEIGQTLSRVAGRPVEPLFVPHLLPCDVGIAESIYLTPRDSQVTQADLFEAYEDAYGGEPFVRLRGPDGPLPNIKHVAGTNFVDLTVRLVGGEDTPIVCVFVCEDNLIKGTAGQAVQCLNAVMGWEETLGLL